jgi:hypothetical protein
MNQPNQKRPPFQRRNDDPAHTHSVAGYQEGGQPERKQTYLSQLRTEFETLVGTLMTTESATDSPELAIRNAAEGLWHFVSDKIRQSYWNGVTAGASGRVKPKQKFVARPASPNQPARSEARQ